MTLDAGAERFATQESRRQEKMGWPELTGHLVQSVETGLAFREFGNQIESRHFPMNLE